MKSVFYLHSVIRYSFTPQVDHRKKENRSVKQYYNQTVRMMMPSTEQLALRFLT